ncbi:PPOX class probable F420-dependent enzyme [Actinocorallia herbida]|uniref:PPOX class probable F420-dependent enzyme n=1 Tax=Actinocorallia herbida TaxID=58109 RepID=A0A3N1D5G2_9ACTN|nr:TIGR03618 family F420-dependent PPOX class oxidoreductase [Actinocorallia herbida]ROO88764.1 PPOX class probable F420-dependent enzyme [Actinocorallia herbida]
MVEFGPEAVEFWREYHICTLTTLRPDGTPHVVPVGVTLDPEAGVARVICDGGSRKARNAALPGARAVVCQVDKGRYTTLEGVSSVLADGAAVADAVRRYTERYREPRVNPNRVVIEIAIDRVIGTVK